MRYDQHINDMAEQADGGEYWDPHHNELTMGGVTVAECSTREDADFLVYLLQEKGIRSAVLLPDKNFDPRGPQVKVGPDDEVQARSVLTQPVPAGKREAYDSEPEFEVPPPPRCSICGSPEVVLDGVDEANHWRCDVCGHSWTEVVS